MTQNRTYPFSTPPMPVDFLVLNQMADMITTFPHLPALLVMANYALFDRLAYFKREDLVVREEFPRPSALEELRYRYPVLRDFISSLDRHVATMRPREICQLAADLFTWAGSTYPHHHT